MPTISEENLLSVVNSFIFRLWFRWWLWLIAKLFKILIIFESLYIILILFKTILRYFLFTSFFILVSWISNRFSLAIYHMNWMLYFRSCRSCWYLSNYRPCCLIRLVWNYLRLDCLLNRHLSCSWIELNFV